MQSLKTKGHQFDNFFIIGGTVSFRYDNLWWHQWWQCCQIDDLLFSVISYLLDHVIMVPDCTVYSPISWLPAVVTLACTNILYFSSASEGSLKDIANLSIIINWQLVIYKHNKNMCISYGTYQLYFGSFLVIVFKIIKTDTPECKIWSVFCLLCIRNLVWCSNVVTLMCHL